MRISDDLRKCVVYLGYRANGGSNQIRAIGTGFFIHTGEPGGSYLVTARHVVEGPDSLGSDPFEIRFNEKNGGGKLHLVDFARWVLHPDPNVDIAVLPLEPPDWADCVSVQQKYFASDFKLRSKDLGSGDLVYIIGVFYLLHGTDRNRPFVHCGNIALMAEDEPIPVRNWRNPGTDKQPNLVDLNGYLVQAETLPASSGSPVFARRTVWTMARDGSANEEVKVFLPGSLWLLGVWHGAWAGQPGSILAGHLSKNVTVPVGTGIASPATKLIEILDLEELKDQRKEAANAEKARRGVS